MADLMPLCATSEPCAEDTHLVLCPFAGGSASAFRSWRDLRPYGWQVWLAVYPGRDQRMNEACAASIAELADQVLMAIDTHQIAQQQLVIAGHSMGAQVAFEVCLRLEQRGSAPLGLVCPDAMRRTCMAGASSATLKIAHSLSNWSPLVGTHRSY